MEEIFTKAASYALAALGRAGGRVLDKSLDALGDKVLDMLRNRLDDDLGRAALAKAEARPEATTSEAALKVAIQAKVEDDPALGSQLQELLRDAPPVVRQAINQTGDGNAATQVVGNNNTINTTGRR